VPSEAPLAARIREIAESLKTRRPPADTPVTETAPHRSEVVAPSLAEAPATPLRDLIAEYQHVLSRLWLLNIPPAGAADVAEARTLLADQARLCDEIGPEFAAAISRQHARTWARAMGRCPWCGLAGAFHDPDNGEEIAL
jgi:hypothetical protein